MNWFTDNPIGGAISHAADAAVAAGKAAVDAAVAPVVAVVDAAQGKPVSDALKDAIAKQLGPTIATIDVAAAASSLESVVTQQVVSGTLGPDAADVATDLNRLARPLDANTGAAVAHATELFIKTGDLSMLDPAAILMADEVTRCRNLLYPLAASVPSNVISALPTDLQALCVDVRVISESDLPGSLNAPSIAIRHLQKATAMTLVDVIVFSHVRGIDTEQDKFLWAHELQHVGQYRSKGATVFCKEYMGELLGFHAAGGDGINALEREADLSACRYFPRAQPAYIKSCPV